MRRNRVCKLSKKILYSVMGVCSSSEKRADTVNKKLPPPVIQIIPSTSKCGGEIILNVHSSVANPSIEWSSEVAGSKIKLNDSHTHARNVKPGKYSVVVRDEFGASSDIVSMEMKAFPHPVISSYSVFPASGETARDGRIYANIENVPDDATLTLFWSNGACTPTNVLLDVRPGLYVAVLVAVNGKPVSCMHTSSPGIVEIRSCDDDTRSKQNV